MYSRRSPASIFRLHLSMMKAGEHERRNLHNKNKEQEVGNGRHSSLVTLAFSAAIGITFLVLGCALPDFNCWWPMFVLFFYCLVPVPTLMARRFADSLESTGALHEASIFITTGIVCSAFGLPLVLAHAETIQWGACGLVLSGNLVVFLTILGYFMVFGNGDDFDYSSW